MASLNPTQWADTIRQQLLLISSVEEPDRLLSSTIIDEVLMSAPRRKAADPEAKALAQEIAKLLYPPASDDSSAVTGSLIKYEKDIVKLRKYVLQQRKRYIELATQGKAAKNWNKRILNQGPWDPVADPVSLSGPSSLPMPVEISDSMSLEPFFDHLRLDGSIDISSTIRASSCASEAEEPYYGTKTLEFQKGVLYTDRRMDLCKMVLGPQNIADLMESLKTNTFVTHFLLGNNLIGPFGAKCIADFLQDYPDRMDTWYLAGNCIDTTSFKMLVDQWVRSSSVTNIWLKRNPLMIAAVDDIFRLITQTPNLRTLDLDQTELGDTGVCQLFSRLAEHDSEAPLPFRHLYINAVGIGEKGAAAIGSYLASPSCTLDSLYASNNPIGSTGVIALASGLKRNKTLTRLTLHSVGLTDDGVISLCEALREHPTMKTLDLSQSYATADLGSRYNWITDQSTPALQKLITSSTLAYLDLGRCAMTYTGLNDIFRAAQNSLSILVLQAKTIHTTQANDKTAIAEAQEHSRLAKKVQVQVHNNVKRVYGQEVSYQEFTDRYRRWLVNDEVDVRKIDSVYRNRDADLARRGVRYLKKWWDQDDETLAQVMKSAVGPVCAKGSKTIGMVGPV